MTPPLSLEDRAAAVRKAAFDCPYCGTYASQTWNYAVLFVSAQRVTVSTGGAEWMFSRCTGCGDYALWVGHTMVFPRAMISVAASPDMPQDVKALYDEARAVAVVSRRAGAAMARATLELLVKRLDPTAPKGASLAQRLDRLMPEVDPTLRKLLTFVRHVGNTIHVPENADDATVMVLDPDQTAGLELIFEAINELVYTRISRPRIVDEAYGKIPESVRKRAEQAPRAQN